MNSDEIRATYIEVTCDVARDQIAPQVNACAIFLREIAAQLAELNENVRLLATERVCPRCHGNGWICIHCDNSLIECQCPDDGSRNPGSCDRCGITGAMSQAAANLYDAEDASIKGQARKFQALLKNPVSDSAKFTRCSECAKEMPRPEFVPIGELSICDDCIPF